MKSEMYFSIFRMLCKLQAREAVYMDNHRILSIGEVGKGDYLIQLSAKVEQVDEGAFCITPDEFKAAIQDCKGFVFVKVLRGNR